MSSKIRFFFWLVVDDLNTDVLRIQPLVIVRRATFASKQLISSVTMEHCIEQQSVFALVCGD